MVEALDTHVALEAVRGSRRSVDETSWAKLYFQSMSLDGGSVYSLFVSDRATDVVPSHWDHLELLSFVLGEDFRDESGAGLSQQQQHNHHNHVQNS